MTQAPIREGADRAGQAPQDAEQILARRKAEFWERTDYDRAFRGSFGRYMTDVESAALERVLEDRRFGRLLDLGCGHGRFLRWLAPRADRLFGLDFSERLLRIGQRSLAEEPPTTPTTLMRASVTAVPLASSSIDGITCVRVVQHVPNQAQAYAEIQRCLGPGGTLYLVQYNWLSPHGFIRALKIPVKAVLRAVIRAMGREPGFDERTLWTWWPELRRDLEAAGLEVERVTGAWMFPLQYFRSKKSNEAWGWALALANAYEKLADTSPFRYLGAYLIVRCSPKS